ncbi:hypothetical protein H257_12057 [Aphanomyces astaci]|uniref:Uncharacterized protein n=1 Tax=Aphanomyces astaci TaxID=112090 RepID=W4G1U0_APHAT|nr:hypothetical protein H257_12057 [Aphanomyces astaci]ETV73019.1 hypothetical protein H257_12057 [Aphanomyces astaci]|eukprot:XP_009837468.1 hypothetical protein H257_12057 [Aphanomyces astaci]
MRSLWTHRSSSSNVSERCMNSRRSHHAQGNSGRRRWRCINIWDRKCFERRAFPTKRPTNSKHRHAPCAPLGSGRTGKDTTATSAAMSSVDRVRPIASMPTTGRLCARAIPAWLISIASSNTPRLQPVHHHLPSSLTDRQRPQLPPPPPRPCTLTCWPRGSMTGGCRRWWAGWRSRSCCFPLPSESHRTPRPC